jgi:phosphatidate cytidylyltransferase
MQWPRYYVWGPIYGVILATLGLVGDLVVSMMKRDAHLKDTGNVLPGHGGILDRVDSYMLSAPICFFFVKKLLFGSMRVCAW